MDQLTAVTLGVCIPVIIIFGIIALWISKSKEIKDQSLEFFLAAKNSQSTSRIAWSFYAASVGAWVLFAPASFVVDPGYGAGWMGLLCYALFTGLAVIVVAYAGIFVRTRYPDALSIGHYARMRFGRGVEIYVTCLVLLNLSIGTYSKLNAT